MIFPLDVATVRQYVPLGGNFKDEDFGRYQGLILGAELLPIVDAAALQTTYGASALSEVVPDAGLQDLFARYGALRAFLLGMSGHDVNASRSGFTVTSTQNLAPASRERVQQLRGDLESQLYQTALQIYTDYWEVGMWHGRDAKVLPGAMRKHGWRDYLCNSPKMFEELFGRPLVARPPEGSTSAMGGGVAHDGRAWYEHIERLHVLETARGYEFFGRKQYGELLAMGAEADGVECYSAGRLPYGVRLFRRGVLLEYIGQAQGRADLVNGGKLQYTQLREELRLHPMDYPYLAPEVVDRSTPRYEGGMFIA